jgi:hypothetical protein
MIRHTFAHHRVHDDDGDYGKWLNLMTSRAPLLVGTRRKIVRLRGARYFVIQGALYPCVSSRCATCCAACHV